MEKVLISACILGVNCRYDGLNCKNPEIDNLIKQYDCVPFCPEVSGGMSTPRKKSCIRNIETMMPATGQDVLEKKARVYSEDGEDVTDFFIKGANECLKMIKELNISKAFLKSRSPSCGVTSVSCFGTVIKGSGVCAAVLNKHNIELIEKS
ncbi:MAG: DUF523 domain-containing protein [Candidatus Aureabacteria bacterium]|nr:DUF523 domain-containing protein [Candidatus Auribacterota bacterium]